MESWQEMLLVGGALKAGIFSALTNNQGTASEVASRIKGDARAVGIVLEALAQGGYLSKIDQHYRLNGQNEALFGDEDGAQYVGHLYRHNQRLVERWLSLPEVIKSGQPRPEESRFTEGRSSFIKAMDVHARPIAATVVEECLRWAPNAKSVVDIGGGWGTFAAAFAARDLKVTVFDLPEVTEILKARNLPGVSVEPGDFNDRLPSGPYDLAFLANVTHIYGPSHNLALCRRVAEVLNPGGAIAILDFVLMPENPAAAFFAVNMLVNTSSGGAWREAQYREWLESAGFGEVSVSGALDETRGREEHLILARKKR